MIRPVRYLAWGLAALLVLALLAGAGVYLIGEIILSRTYSAPQRSLEIDATPALLDHGERLADLLGCTGCHGDDLEGRVFFSEPGVATIHASNLTRTSRRYSDAQMAAAITHGVRPDGTSLIGMPSAGFVALNDEDLAALIAFLRTLEPSGPDRPQPAMGPIGRALFVNGRGRPAAALAAEAAASPPREIAGHEIGRYLARIACSECHGADLTGDESGMPPDLVAAAAYSPEQFRTLMRTGVAAGGRELGLMTTVARSRFGRFTDAEIAELHGYLRARAETRRRD